MWRTPRPATNILRILHRSQSTSAKDVRQTFLEYFKSKNHIIIPSSSVVPRQDKTLSFVNAGMNQFKNVFLGQEAIQPDMKRLANSQKCIRVGGKHNDLEAVGTDGNHHTFFEMLGSWSFGDYFKAEACSMAWELLTGPYNLDKSKLYVTYFGGCEKTNLPADEETRQIWLSLGVPEAQILPFDSKDNFWEMGASGPCGRCTEIHYDHSGQRKVNAGVEDCVEIWNLVFMEHNRLADGSIEPLENRFVDTGMGLERLTAVINNSTSNYDSDLFQPIFDGIARSTGARPYQGQFSATPCMDTGYRILADHARMITVAIADGTYPDTNHRLRNVIRRSFRTSKEFFGAGNKGLMIELSNVVADTLGDQFPEIHKNLSKVHTVLSFEEAHYQQLQKSGEKIMKKLVSDFPSALGRVDLADATHVHDGLKYLEKNLDKDKREITGELGFKMYDSWGFNARDISMLAEIMNVNFNENEFQEVFDQRKHQSKLSSIGLGSSSMSFGHIPPTDDSAKYKYGKSTETHYQFSVTEAAIKCLVRDGEEVGRLSKNEKGMILLDKTSFYAEAGGQVGDIGTLVAPGGSFKVTDTQLIGSGHVAHIGKVTKGSVSVEDEVKVKIDVNHRLGCMQNHTGTHLLNSVLNDLLPLTCQRSSFVGPDYFRFEFNTFNVDLDTEKLVEIETAVNQLIADAHPIESEQIQGRDLSSIEGIVTLPGEIYPDQVTLVRLPKTVEPCCGTHVLNTADVQGFVITGMKSTGTGVKMLKCLTGNKALDARDNGIILLDDVGELHEHVERNEGDRTKELLKVLSKFKNEVSKDLQVPFAVKSDVLEVTDELLRHVKSSDKSSIKNMLESELEEVIEDLTHIPFIVHMFEEESQDTKLPLSNLVKMCKDKPILLLGKGKDGFVGKAVVPSRFVDDQFDASKWMAVVAKAIGSTSSPPRGQDPSLVCNMKGKKVEDKAFVKQAVAAAKDFVRDNIKLVEEKSMI